MSRSLYYKQKGFSLIEIILALGIFSLVAASMAAISVGGFNALLQGGQHTEATALAQEGFEAIRAIRDRAWNENTYTQSGVQISGSQWDFLGQGTTETIGNYTRTITFADVCRDGSDNIVACPGVYTDIHTKEVTVRVEWTIRPLVTNHVEYVGYLSNWDGQDWIQTDWSGGAGQTIWSNTDQYDSDDAGLNENTGGQLELAAAGGGAWVSAGGTSITETTDTEFSAGTLTDVTVDGTGAAAGMQLTASFDWAPHADSGVATTSRLRWVDAVSASDVWAVGDGGMIIHYDGTSWSSITSPTNQNLYSIDMVSASDGWIVGRSGKILRWNGTAWTEFVDTGNEAWNAVSLSSASNGWAGAQNGRLAEWNGTSWTESTIPSTDRIYSMLAISASDVWAGGRSGNIWHYNGSGWVYHTDTGGENWYDFDYVSSSDVWAGGSSQVANFDGSSWVESTPGSSDDMRGISVVAANNIWGAGDSGRFWNYDGTSWSLFVDKGGMRFRNMVMTSATSGWAVGDSGVIYEYANTYAATGTFESAVTDSGTVGAAWNTVSWAETLPTGADIEIETRTGPTATPDGSWSGWSVSVTDETGSTITSPANQYLQYRITFTRGTSPAQTPRLDDITFLFNAPTGEHLYALSGTSLNNVWAVGANGEIIQYNGTVWSAVTSPTTENLWGLHIRTTSEGWASGESGKILIYNGTAWTEDDDRGNETWRDIQGFTTGSYTAWTIEGRRWASRNGTGTWSEANGPVNADYNAFDFIGASDGWLVGEAGTILQYNGTTFSSVASPVSTDLFGVSMVSTSDVWAAGADGKILHYNGTTWTEYVDTGTQTWRAIFMIDASTGWVVGDGGVIYGWDGSSWSAAVSPTTENLHDVYFADVTQGWAVGDNGTILRFDGGAGYVTSGSLISSAFDMGDASPVQIIEWDEVVPSCTPVCTVRLQVRTAPDAGGSPGTWTSWYGAAGAGSYFTDANGSLVSTALNGNQWVQYQVFLDGDGVDTPLLEEVRVNYK